MDRCIPVAVLSYRSLTLPARMVRFRMRSEPGAQATGQDPALALGVRMEHVLGALKLHSRPVVVRSYRSLTLSARMGVENSRAEM
jgi:hypothetical protein